jgi:hypothetical protein
MGASPATTLVIVLGAGKFPKLPEHMSNAAFRKSSAEFCRYLVDRNGFGLAAPNLLDLFDNPAGPSEQDEQIGQFLSRRIDDLRRSGSPATDLIVYYVGHGGFFPPHDQYFLALAGTKEGSEGISGYPIRSLAATLKRASPWLRHYLILDCCFSAAAYQAFQASGPMEVARKKTEEELPPRGTALLCAASPRDPAKAPHGESYTMFSGVLMELLWQGVPDLPARVSLAEVGQRVEELIRWRYTDSAVRPEVHSPDQQKGDLAQVPLFPNHSRAARPETSLPSAVPAVMDPGSPDRSRSAGPRRRRWRWRIGVAVAALVAATLLLTVLGYGIGLLGREDIADRLCRTVTLKAKKEKTEPQRYKKGDREFTYWFWIDAPADVMDRIETVTYRLRPLNPTTKYPDYPALYPRQSGFKSGYDRPTPGPWDGRVDLLVTLKDGRTVTCIIDPESGRFGE